MFIICFRNGNVVKAVGDAYIADEKDPGKLKLRFSNCKYANIDMIPTWTNCIEFTKIKLLGLIESFHVQY